MARRVLWKAMLVSVAGATCWGLARWLGPWLGFAVWTGAIGLACVGAAIAVKGARPGEITWRNRLAGYLITWAMGLTRGQLGRMVVVSWAAWVAIGLAVTMLVVRDAPAASAPTSATVSAAPAGASTVALVLLFAAWVIDGMALIYIFGVLATNFRPGSSAGRSMLKLMATLLAMLGGSVALWLNGRPGWAAAVAGGPVLLLGLAYGLFIALMLTAGRNARWN